MASVSTPADNILAEAPVAAAKPKDTNPAKKVVMDAMVKNFSQNAYVAEASGNALQIFPPVTLL